MHGRGIATVLLVLIAVTAHAAIEASSWDCAVQSRIRELVETKTGLGSNGGPPGRHRFRATFSGVRLEFQQSTWALGSLEFGTLSGSSAIGTQRVYLLAGGGQNVSGWVHDRILAATVSSDLEVMGSTLVGILRLNPALTALKGLLRVSYTAEGPTDLFVGSITIPLRCNRL